MQDARNARPLLRAARRGLSPLAVLFALMSLGCNREANAVTERFLGALTRDDYAAAFAELHTEALPYTPDAATLGAQIEKSGRKILDWSSNCGSSGEMARTAYNVTTQDRNGLWTTKRPLLVGVLPERRGRCNGPLVVELKREAALPGAPWKVRSVKLD